MKRIKNKISEFKEWQKTPFSVAPLSDEEFVCHACDTRYKGNYCPRCGQSSKVEQKMSLVKTFLLFIDVWGIGNRGMFHTLRDLILRPGYMICDYLRGKRSAYFPPFKLLFLLTTLSLIIGNGFNLFQINYIHDYHIDVSDIQSDSSSVIQHFFGLWNYTNELQDSYPALFRLFVMTVTCIFYYICFKKSKIIGKLSYHEFFVAMVYMVNMANIYSIMFRFFGAPDWLIAFPTFLYIIPLKQMSGYGAISTLFRFILSWIMILAFFLILFFGILSVLVVLYHN